MRKPGDITMYDNKDGTIPSSESGEGILDDEINRLFDDARSQIEKIDGKAKQQKKKIVVDLAKRLEEKIAKDSISAEIVIQLHDQVSPSFIRECLGEEYKQKHRIANARKRQKLQQEPVSPEKLATLPLLNQEAPKKMVMLGVDGQEMLQEEQGDDDQDDEGEDDRQSTITKGASITKHVPLTELELPQPQKQQEESEKPITGYPDDRYLQMEDVELEEEFEEPSQSIVPDKTSPAAPSSIHYNESGAPEDDILDFEFSMVFGDIQEYVSSLYRRTSDNSEVWFNGIIDTKTKKIVHAGLGRTSKEQQG